MPSHRRQVLLLTAASVLISARDVQALLKAVAGWARRKSAFAYPTALAFGRYDEDHLLHAARTEFMNFATSCFSRLLSVDSDCAADSTCEEAPPASDAPRWTSAILASTCEVPSAARCTFREISWVAAPCSSTADAIVAEISDIRAMVAPISLIAVTESLGADWMSAICWLISSVAFAVCSAGALPSAATTANPLPASPARAASMVAFSAKRLVCPAMV